MVITKRSARDRFVDLPISVGVHQPKAVLYWCQGTMPAEGTRLQKELRRLLEDLALIGLQEVHEGLARGAIPLAAASWDKDLEADAIRILVDRITRECWRILFGNAKGSGCYPIRKGNKKGGPLWANRGLENT